MFNSQKLFFNPDFNQTEIEERDVKIKKPILPCEPKIGPKLFEEINICSPTLPVLYEALLRAEALKSQGNDEQSVSLLQQCFDNGTCKLETIPNGKESNNVLYTLRVMRTFIRDWAKKNVDKRALKKVQGWLKRQIMKLKEEKIKGDDVKEKIKMLFRMFDQDKDNHLNFEELQVFFKSTIDKKLSYAEYRKMCVQLICEEAEGFDKNALKFYYCKSNPASVLGRDFRRLLPNADLRRNKIEKIFRVFDRDEDGFLNRIELSHFLNIISDDGMLKLNEGKFMIHCSNHGCHPSQGITVDALSKLYSTVDEDQFCYDYNQVFPKSLKKTNCPQCESKIKPEFSAFDHECSYCNQNQVHDSVGYARCVSCRVCLCRKCFNTTCTFWDDHSPELADEKMQKRNVLSTEV